MAGRSTTHDCGGQVNVGASPGSYVELVVGSHLYLLVVAVRNGGRCRDGHGAQINCGNFATKGGQRWGAGSGARSPQLGAGDVEGVVQKQADGAGVHGNARPGQVAV